jgi:hypothetical protein
MQISNLKSQIGTRIICKKVSSAIILTALALLPGCSTERQVGDLFGTELDTGRLVIDGLLIVGRPLPEVLVSETIAPGQPVTDANSGVAGAQVTISAGGVSYVYINDAETSALYHPLQNVPAVEPNTLYTLTVNANGRVATANTMTPGRFTIRNAVLLDEQTLDVAREFVTYPNSEDVFAEPANQIIYQDGLLEARFEPSQASGYQVGVLSLDEGSPFVLTADFLEDDDYEDFERNSSSPAFLAPNGTLRLPWFAIAFAGRHTLRIFAVDRNWFDFVRTSPVFGGDGGFGGNAGDNFKFPVFNVEGGIGVFGSASVDSLGFVIVPRDTSDLRPSNGL